MKAQTKSTKFKDVKRVWHLIDAKDKILGRTATEIALFLMGKNKPDFVRNLDMGDFVVVINSKQIKTTGNKETLKKYYRHSGFPGGFKMETLQDLRQRNPNEVIIHAVSGMLPQNRLRDQMLNRLYVFPTEEHIYKDKFKKGELI